MAGTEGERRLAALVVRPHPGPSAVPPAWPDRSGGVVPDPTGDPAPEELLLGAELRTVRALAAAAQRERLLEVDDSRARRAGAGGAPWRRWAVHPALAALAGAVLLALAAVVAVRTLVPSRPAVLATVADASDAPTPTPTQVVVHVVGEVTDPGVVTLPQGSRVVDAIEAAGGAGPGAELAALNLARVVVDGEQVLVPGPGATPAGDGARLTADGRLDLNAADAAALDALPGIGPVLAARVVAWRDEHGAFSSVDELAEVSGIGPAVLASVRDLVRV